LIFALNVANGAISPGLAYFAAITESEQEAKILKAQYEAMRRSKDG